jgi:hypothetical protein
MATYTNTQLQAAAKHAIGKDSPSTNTTFLQMVNRAIELLAIAGPWAWRNRIASVAVSTGYGDLPADFGELICVSAAAGVTKFCLPVSFEQLAKIRQFSTAVAAATAGAGRGIYYHVVGKDQASATAAARYRLAVAPTGFAGNVDACYRMIPAAMDADGTDVPNIPEGFQDTLLQAVRAIAKSEEAPSSPESGPTWDVLQKMLEIHLEAEPRVTGLDRARLSEVVEEFKLARFLPTYA